VFGFTAGQGMTQSPATLHGIWLMFSIFPAIGALLSLPILRAFKLRDNYVQVMAQVNQGEISREEAYKVLPQEFHVK
jgi:Na+/melibiose symporter-like transporter